MSYENITQIKNANAAAGYYFFQRATMKFFNSKIETKVIAGRYFITSERMDTTMPKMFRIRIAHDNGMVETLRTESGEVKKYKYLWQAKEDLKTFILNSKDHLKNEKL